MAFDETYNEPEIHRGPGQEPSTPNIRPSCTMPTPGDAGADLISHRVDVDAEAF